MKESAATALSYLQANAKKYNIDPEVFNKKNIHIHVPEGAVPKDGPSAGVTMLTSLASAFTGKKSKALSCNDRRNNFARTGIARRWNKRKSIGCKTSRA